MPENHDPFENLTAPIAAPILAATPEHQGALQAPQPPYNAELPAAGVSTQTDVAPISDPAPTPMPTPSAGQAHGGPGPGRGRTSPQRPVSPEDRILFTMRWRDPALTLDTLGRLYDCNPRTIQKWSVAFGLGPRDLAAQPAAEGSRAEHDAVGPRSLPAESDERWNPMANGDIRAAMDDICQEAVAMTAHSDLTAIQRKLTRLSVVVAAKAPAYTWPRFQEAIQGLSRAMLYARKVEAKLPETGADPVVLRKEAASQMMRELKSVLTPEEQQVLARVMQTGADRLMARSRKP